MVECKEDREDLSKWGNDPRQSFRTLATAAHVFELDARMLMNHAFAGVNEGYITRGKLIVDHLTSCTASAFVATRGRPAYAISADIFEPYVI